MKRGPRQLIKQEVTQLSYTPRCEEANIQFCIRAVVIAMSVPPFVGRVFINVKRPFECPIYFVFCIAYHQIKFEEICLYILPRILFSPYQLDNPRFILCPFKDYPFGSRDFSRPFPGGGISLTHI